MRYTNSIIVAILTCAALSACGSTTSTQLNTITNSSLTTNQMSLLNDGVDPNAVYDAVDGAKIATVSGNSKNSVHL